MFNAVDTWKPEEKNTETKKEEADLPF